MRSLLDWTLNAIREENSDFSWMEERRYKWTPLVEHALQCMLAGQTVLLLTDPKRRWFEHYILNAINDTTRDRPFLSVQSMHGVFVDVQGINTHMKITLMEDMLDIAYSQGYFIWYIGDGGHPYAKLAYNKENNFLWLINEEIEEGSFLLRDSDPLMDIKLLQLYRLFDRSVDAVLHGQVELS
jgi:hypothetical protein